MAESEIAALRVIAAAGRTVLGDDEAVAPCNCRIRSYDGLQPQEIPVGLCANHTFYSGCYWYRHLDRSICLEPLPVTAVMSMQSSIQVQPLSFFDTALRLRRFHSKHLESDHDTYVTVRAAAKSRNSLL